MAAAQLSLLSNPITAAFLGMPGQPSTTVVSYTGANTAGPQIKPEPSIPANASRPYYPEREDRDSSSCYYNNRVYDDRAERRNSRNDYEYDRPSRHDYRDDYRSYRDSRYDYRYERVEREPPRYSSPRPDRCSPDRDSRYSDRRSPDRGYSNRSSPDSRYLDRRCPDRNSPPHKNEIQCFNCGEFGHISKICQHDQSRDDNNPYRQNRLPSPARFSESL